MTIRIEFSKETKYKDYKISKRKDGRFVCRIPISCITDEEGNKKRYVYKEIYGVDRNDVALKRAQFIESQAEKAEKKKATDELFATQLKSWLYDEKYGTVKDTSFDRLEGILLHQILPAINALEHTKLTEINSKDIKDLLKYNLNKGYSYSTLLKIYRFLNEFFQHQHLAEVIPRNPVKQVRMYKKDHVAKIQQSLQKQKAELLEKEKHGETLTEDEAQLAYSPLRCNDREEPRFLTDDEIKRLELATAATYGNGSPKVKQAKFFLFMLNTGLRAGEALALKYSDFDFDNRTVQITRNITSSKERDASGKTTSKRSVKEGTTKTASSMAVLSINKKAAEIIQELKSQEEPGYLGAIIHGATKAPIEPRALEKRFYKLLEIAEIEQTGLHTLRHTFASKLYEATNGDTKFVSEMLRHKSVSFTAQTYIHLESKFKKSRVNDFEI